MTLYYKLFSGINKHMANDVKILSDDSLQHAGFSAQEIEAAKSHSDAFVGERDGIKYYRGQNELNIDLGDYKTREVKMPDQQGDRS